MSIIDELIRTRNALTAVEHLRPSDLDAIKSLLYRAAVVIDGQQRIIKNAKLNFDEIANMKP